MDWGVYKVVVKKKPFPERVHFAMSNYGENELQAFLDVISEKTEPPHNKTSVIAALHARGLKVNRLNLDCDFYVLERSLKVINTERTFNGHAIRPLYTKATIKEGTIYFD